MALFGVIVFTYERQLSCHHNHQMLKNSGHFVPRSDESQSPVSEKVTTPTPSPDDERSGSEVSPAAAQSSAKPVLRIKI